MKVKTNIPKLYADKAVCLEVDLFVAINAWAKIEKLLINNLTFHLLH